ncbi:MAG: tRNA-binding protein [Actinobacteria bacterium]|nr:tRNA-binding protein [Actinomycetota bacterium]
MKTKPHIEWKDFEKIDIRTGTVVDVIDFAKATKPAYKLYIDFGDLGILKSSAQITERYDKLDLVGNQVLAVVNFPPKQIADFMSECLVLGVYDKKGVVLITTAEKTPNGLPIG